MNKMTTHIAALLFAAALAACGGGSGTSAANGAAAAVGGGSGGGSTALAPPKALGDACSADCGAGGQIGILCAADETPVCDCSATPRTQCSGS